MIVTRAEGNLLVELAGRSAIDRLEEVVEAAGPTSAASWPPACTWASPWTSTA